jgi:hypothetical protein
MIALAGCVQPTLTPNTNAATARVLDRLGIELIEVPGAACCGALRYHLHAQEKALDDMRQVIDAWWPHVESGSRRGLRDDRVGLRRACAGLWRVAEARSGLRRQGGAHCCHDARCLRGACRRAGSPGRVAAPGGCRRQRPAGGLSLALHLQHAQKIRGVVEALLTAAGYQLSPVADPHLCCGSAGTYSISQPVLATQLRDNKLAAMARRFAGGLVTANIGCQTHLQSGSTMPVRHWIELIDERLSGGFLRPQPAGVAGTGKRWKSIVRRRLRGACRTFRWQVPEQFNIAVDVCGRWAEDRSRFALYYEDESGFTSAHTFWDIQRQANRLSNVLAALARCRRSRRDPPAAMPGSGHRADRHLPDGRAGSPAVASPGAGCAGIPAGRLGCAPGHRR